MENPFFYSNLSLWFLFRKVPKEFHLDYDKLEDRPSLPQTLIGGGGTSAGSSGVLTTGGGGANNANSSNGGGAGVGPGGIPHGPSPVHMNENNNAPGPAAGGRQQQHSPSVLASAASLIPGGGSGAGSDGRPPQFWRFMNWILSHTHTHSYI